MSSRAVTPEPTPQGSDGGGPAAHSQDYYWTDEWQANEAIAIEEIRTGKARVFDNADEAIKWLMSAEHHEDPDRPNWCASCRCAWPCPSSYVREPVPPVSLTRGGFMLSR